MAEIIKLRDFVIQITEPLTLTPRSEYCHLSCKERFQLYIHRYSKHHKWLCDVYPEFARVMARIMVDHQYDWVSDHHLRIIGNEIAEKARPFIDKENRA